MSAGYSKTPLIKKLGIKEGFGLRIIHPPDHYFELLGPLPPEVQLLGEEPTLADFVHLFCADRAQLLQYFSSAVSKMHKDAMLWVSWYKKASKVPTDIKEDDIRTIALQNGLVDIKVCAVDEQWSALKIVWRKENRYTSLHKIPL